MSSYGAVTISEGMQSPTLSSLGDEIRAAREIDAGMGKTPGVNLSPGQGMLILFADMRDSLLTIQENTLETAQLIKDSVIPLLGGTPAQQRDDDISEGETDKKDSRGFGDRLRGIGNALDKVNPFSSGFAFGNIGRALLAGGGLILLKTFGENLIGPLASLLEMIKKAEIGEKISDVVDRGMLLFEDLKKDVERFIAGMVAVGNIIKDLYLSAEEFIMSYDKDESGTISKDEFQTMVDDLVGAILKAVGQFFKDFGVEIAGIFALPGLLSLGKSMVTRAVTGTAAVPALGIVGTLGLAAIVAAGTVSLINAHERAFQDAVTDEAGNPQNFNYKEYISSFLGRKKEGGLMNAFGNMLEKAAIGGAAGVGVALFVKTGIALGIPFGPIGMAAGALGGILIGAAVGLVTGLIGGDGIKKFLTNLENNFNTLKEKVGSFFSNMFAGIRSIFVGDSFAEGVAGNKLKKEKETLEGMKEQYALMDPDSDEAKEFKTNVLEPQQKLVANLSRNLSTAQESDELKDLRSEASRLTEENLALSTRENMLKNPGEFGMAPFLANEKLNPDLNNDIISNNKTIIENNKKLMEINAKIAALSGGSPHLGMALSSTTPIKTEIPAGPDIGFMRALNNAGGGGASVVNVSDVKTNSDNTQVGNYSLGGLTVGNSDTETRALVESRF